MALVSIQMMNTRRWMSLGLAGMVAGLMVGVASAPAAQPTALEQNGPMPEVNDADASKLLKVGDPAPALSVVEWVKGEPVSSFEAGKIYVVEFWATWCGPCRTSIPRLTALQKKYGDRVTIIGVDIWENAKSLKGDSSYLPRVKTFVEDRGGEMDYRVAFGGEIAKMGETWMQAAGRDGIPSAFIVQGTGAGVSGAGAKEGGGGRIVWIGNPLLPDDRFEENLEAAINGTLDEAAMKKQAETSLQRWTWIRTSRKLENDFRKVRVWGTPDEVRTAADKLIEFDSNRARQAAVFAYTTLATKKSQADADAYAKTLTEGVYKDDALVLNSLVWAVVGGDVKGAKRVDWEFMEGLATRSDALAGGQNPAVIDTLARVQFLRGRVDDAIATQTRAVQVAQGDAKGIMQKALDEYRAAKK